MVRPSAWFLSPKEWIFHSFRKSLYPMFSNFRIRQFSSPHSRQNRGSVKRMISHQVKVLQHWSKSHFNIDAHGLKIQRSGYLMFIDQNPQGGQGFQEKLPGGPPILGFIAFLLRSFSKICLRGCCFIPPPPSSPLCASMHFNHYIK